MAISKKRLFLFPASWASGVFSRNLSGKAKGHLELQKSSGKSEETMDLSNEDVIQILRLLNESHFEELHLEIGDLKLVVNRQGRAADPGRKSALPPYYPTQLNPKSAATGPAVNDLVDTTSVNVDSTLWTLKVAAERSIEDGFIPIKSPTLGNFYRAPKPGAPPFVEEGSDVMADTTVCIIEVMKLFSTITAGMKGRIHKICAEDGELVEYDQVLFWVDPHTEST